MKQSNSSSSLKPFSKPSKVRPKILLLSGYDAASHRHWRKLLQKCLPEFHWTQIALPDRHFSWRARGNSLSFAFLHEKDLNLDYDCLIVTSMVDLSSLRGFIPRLGTIPTLIYFHENQFAFPVSSKNKELINPQLTSIYSLLCSDRVLFNSHFNQSSFFTGAKKLLKKLPDLVPRNVLDHLELDSVVLPVPIDEAFFVRTNEPLTIGSGCQVDGINRPTSSNDSNSEIQILWNHRWEFDKQPEVFFEALRHLKKDKIPFKLHIVGQVFRSSPKCFDIAKNEFQQEIVSWGFQDKNIYRKILANADVVISSALHDFQGLSMLEAIASGCIPIAPRRVAYPDYVPDCLLYECESECCDTSDEAYSLSTKLMEVLTTISKNTKNNGAIYQRQSYNGENILQCSLNEIISDQKALIEFVASRYSQTSLCNFYRHEIQQLLS